MSRKISLPVVITAVLIAAAIAFSAAYIFAYFSLNKDLTELAEKQAMFSSLSEVDGFVREKYNGEKDEEAIQRAICEAYCEALGEDVIYLTAQEYKESEYKSSNGYIVDVLSNGDAVVILNTEGKN